MHICASHVKLLSTFIWLSCAISAAVASIMTLKLILAVFKIGYTADNVMSRRSLAWAVPHGMIHWQRNCDRHASAWNKMSVVRTRRSVYTDHRVMKLLAGMHVGLHRNRQHNTSQTTKYHDHVSRMRLLLGNNGICVWTFYRTVERTGVESATCLMHYTPFTRSSKHRANVEQMYSKYTC